VAAPRERLFSFIGFTVTPGKIAESEVAADPESLRQLDLRSSMTDDQRRSRSRRHKDAELP
jgi:hypothetical protein